MEMMKGMVVDALVELFSPRCVYERSDVTVRRQEGLLTMPTGVLYGKEPAGLVLVHEHGLKFFIDVVRGQKTGFFLDQRENRQALQRYVSKKKILNLFSYSGGFSCYALAGGAEHVTSVDISAGAIELCEKNIVENGFSALKYENVVADVFEYLKTTQPGSFDVVIVDPPAFVKSRKDLQSALKAYSRLNEQAMRLVVPGGILVTSSCSGHVTPEMFKQSLFQAALKAGRVDGGHLDAARFAGEVRNIRSEFTPRIIEQRGQPFDHPVSIYFPEGEYLKFFVLEC